MLFLDEHVRAILPALTARRAACDAMVGCLSAAEIVRTTKAQPLRHERHQAQRAGFPEAPARQAGRRQSRCGGQRRPQMALVRKLPKILRFIPGSAQDVRAYFLTLQLLARRLRGERRRPRALPGGALRRRPPRGWRDLAAAPARATTPETGLYHPALAQRITEDPAALPRQAGARGGSASADALLRAGRQHRPLRRGDRGARSARPRRGAGLRGGPSTTAGGGGLLHAERGRLDRRAGLAHRVLAGRRPGLQRRGGGGSRARPPRRALPRRPGAGVPERSSSGRPGRAASRRSRPP